MKDLRTLFSIISVLTASHSTQPFAADGGDFSPLKVGNTWKYMGSASSSSLTTPTGSFDEILRTILVESQKQSGNAIVFRISIRDSLYNRTTRYAGQTTSVADAVRATMDSVSQAVDGSFSSTALSSFFHVHSVPDSALSGTVAIGGRNLWVYAWNDSSRGSENAEKTSRTFAQDVGLIDYQDNGYGPLSSWSNQYRAVEFNGAPLGVYNVVSVFRARSAPPSGSGFSGMDPEGVRAANRNVLGRKLNPIRPLN